jgi:adenine-specific DNA-methyltransferase
VQVSNWETGKSLPAPKVVAKLEKLFGSAVPTASRQPVLFAPSGGKQPPPPARKAPAARAAKAKASTTKLDTTDYRHPSEKRTNIPPAKIASEGRVPKVAKARYAYSPHLPPVLRFDATGQADKVVDRVGELLAKATQSPLTPEEAGEVREALANYQPWLEWAGKREQHERGWFEVDPVALHIHERVSAQACIRAALREDVQRDLFADPQQPYREAVQFYRHDVDWANRLILGDSLQVMSSLARRENLAGKVHMIYMDPPYGVLFRSNFQPEIASRSVKENDSDLTREPEVVRAFRDTWQLGIHTYLTFLRDRLSIARELLSNEGSLFIQISDDNVHCVRAALDDCFGRGNFVSAIVFTKSSGLQAADRVASRFDYLLWYSKDRDRIKFRPLTETISSPRDAGFLLVEEESGHRRSLTQVEAEDTSALPRGSRVLKSEDLTKPGPGAKYEVEFDGKLYTSGARWWGTPKESLRRVAAAGRVLATDKVLRFCRFLQDAPHKRLTNLWSGLGGASNPLYVVQTSTEIVSRCLLMTTDPGDLVLDPTCGSGTTAFVAEQWGRRWITVDTSRVAIAISRQRLMTARFEHYRTKGGPVKGNEQAENPASGLRYREVPHITLKSIAQNTNLDPIFEKHEPILEAALTKCNAAVGKVTTEQRKRLAGKLAEKQRTEGKRAVTDADRRRWELPTKAFEHWTVPFDTDPDWPVELQKAVTAYRKAWRAKMDEVNACIEANAEQEELVDQPEVVKGVVRVSGPFTVEGVRPEELSLGEEGLFDPTPNEFDPEESGPDPRLTNLQAYLTKMVQSLRADGLTFLGNKRRKFARLEALVEQATGSVIHAEGAWEGEEGEERLPVAITFGPQYGPVTALQVEEAIRSARRYTELVVAGFSFDAEASAVIEEANHPTLRIHAAYIRPDINPAMDGLLKETPGSQLFTVFGQPDVEVKRKKSGDWVVRLEGVDIYDPIANAIRSTGADKVAAWFLDQDYDGRCFCITQAFFPDQDAWEKLAKALKGSADPEAFEAFKGTESLPFPTGKHARIAVKVIDPRGNEVMAVRKLEG